MGYSTWGHKESDRTDRLTLSFPGDVMMKSRYLPDHGQKMKKICIEPFKKSLFSLEAYIFIKSLNIHLFDIKIEN